MKKLKKRAIAVAICIIMIFVPAFSSFAAGNWVKIDVLWNSIELYVNNEKLNGIKVFENFGTTYVPIRDVAEKLGYTVTYNEALQRGYINSKNNGTTSNTTKADLMIASIYKDAEVLFIAIATPTMNASSTALTMAYMGKYDDAKAHFNNVNTGNLTNLYEQITELNDKFSDILTKYGLSSNSNYKTRYNSMVSMLSAIKTRCISFTQATTYLLDVLKSGSDSQKISAYNAYNDELVKLQGVIETYKAKTQGEYDTIMKGIVGSDYSLITD